MNKKKEPVLFQTVDPGYFYQDSTVKANGIKVDNNSKKIVKIFHDPSGGVFVQIGEKEE